MAIPPSVGARRPFRWPRVDSAEEGAVESRPSVLDRYSPVKVSVLLHLPESNARSFLIASALGAILDRDGTRNSLKSAKDATGVVISEKRGDRIRRELGIGPRHWRRLVNDWERRQIAHRCSPGIVVLFTTPFLPECPACQKAGRGPTSGGAVGEVEVERQTVRGETDASRPRNGRITSARRRRYVRGGGANASASRHGFGTPKKWGCHKG